MINKYEFLKTEIEGLYVINPFYVTDERGCIKKSFEKNIFYENNIIFEPIEEMETTSKKNVIRGLHFQRKNSQGKLIRCVRGAILDVVVDLRKGSKTFGKTFKIVLSEENKKMLYIPREFAHGCRVLIDNTTFYYLADNKYSPEHDSGILWNDKFLNIDWELNNENEAILSEKDKRLSTFEKFKEELFSVNEGIEDEKNELF